MRSTQQMQLGSAQKSPMQLAAVRQASPQSSPRQQISRRLALIRQMSPVSVTTALPPSMRQEMLMRTAAIGQGSLAPSPRFAEVRQVGQPCVKMPASFAKQRYAAHTLAAVPETGMPAQRLAPSASSPRLLGLPVQHSAARASPQKNGGIARSVSATSLDGKPARQWQRAAPPPCVHRMISAPQQSSSDQACATAIKEGCEAIAHSLDGVAQAIRERVAVDADFCLHADIRPLPESTLARIDSPGAREPSTLLGTDGSDGMEFSSVDTPMKISVAVVEERPKVERMRAFDGSAAPCLVAPSSLTSTASARGSLDGAEPCRHGVFENSPGPSSADVVHTFTGTPDKVREEICRRPSSSQ